MLRIFQIISLVVGLAGTPVGGNQQSWSHYTYNDEPYSLVCQSDNYRLKASDTVTWHRHGMSDPLVSDDHFELKTSGGVPNAELYFKSVTDSLHGIYVCHIHDSNGVLLDSLVLGVNRGVRLYHDDMDRYKDKVVVGAIAGGSTLVLIISVCLVSAFRYLPEESVEKRRQRKDDRARQQHQEGYGHRNQAYSTEMTEGNSQNKVSNTMESSFVHF